MRRLPLAPGLLTVLAVLGIGGPDAAAHPHLKPPPIEVFITIKDGEVRLSTHVEEPLLRSRVEWPAGDANPSPEQAGGFLAETLEMSVDGKAVPLDVEGVQPLFTAGVTNPDGSPREKSFALKASTRVEETPRSLALRWRDFAGVLWETEVVVPMTINTTVDRQFAMTSHSVTPEDPAWIWHSTPRDATGRFQDVTEVAWTPPLVRTSWPLLPAVLGALGALGLLAALRRPRPFAAAGLLLLAAAGGAFALDVGSLVQERPGSLADALPSEAGAAAIFDQLLDNVYATFDIRRRAVAEATEDAGSDGDAWTRGGLRREDEDAIYDLLSRTASPALLARLYQHVFKSLVLEEGGGAVSVVEDVVVDSHRVTFPLDRPRPTFVMEATWTMTCAVHHWGHTHRRRNEYAATFEVVEDGGSWKFDSFRVDRHERVSLDAPTEPTAPAPEGAADARGRGPGGDPAR